MALTGGPLNKLNGTYGISAPSKSVPVMRLIKIHKPKSKEELVKLIKSHSQKECSCGIKSQGSIEDFGNNLYDVQIKAWGKHKFSLKECINWEYNLFIVQSLKGNHIEEKAKNEMGVKLDPIKIIDAEKYLDEEIRIDLEVRKKGKLIAGIQVKPSSYHFMRKNVKQMNQYRNSLVKYPIFYLYYNYNSEEFFNVENIINKIKKL
jgi:hypothetical protein